MHPTSVGVSSAHNTVFDISRDKWITFIGSDDFMNTNYIENLYEPVIKDLKLEFVHGSASFWTNGKIIEHNKRYYKQL